ncbi:phosphoadenylyl-sulfate reductase [Allosphingosinicella deserti]|uniref:Adenosine 5'-phosphosulfate reductase n=1 Tax=Allosphingosinicella deserti TaxID=2116704 RepID=A0A2P7QWG9_9SPHN|nr:phosphoadenylyl-sulfate reductase [Sphingomonas deserti]PSJ42300.1 phosphoadenylyl-sulfate reductase [Sphingomonas deserti]
MVEAQGPFDDRRETLDAIDPVLADVAQPALIARIGGETIPDRLRAACAAIDGRLVFTTSFGIEDQLIAHHIFTEKLPVEIVTLDTGRLFPSTYQLWQETEERYGVRIKSFHPDANSVAAMVADAGINGFYHSKDARISCCTVRKVEPLGRALSGAAAWVTGLRADQSGQRAAVDLAAWDRERGLIKLAPLFDWTRDRVAAECTSLGIPVNALHAKGFLSIGCEPCTRALQPGEPERAGRWWWESDEARECGLHVGADGRLVRSKAAAAAPAEAVVSGAA